MDLTNLRRCVLTMLSLFFVFTTANAMLVNVPATLQAEDYIDALDTTTGNSGGAYRNENVDIQATMDTGGGFNIGWIAGNEWLEYEIAVPQTGEFIAHVRVASLPGGGRYRLHIDGTDVGSSNSVESTGGWQS